MPKLKSHYAGPLRMSLRFLRLSLLQRLLLMSVERVK